MADDLDDLVEQLAAETRRYVDQRLQAQAPAKGVTGSDPFLDAIEDYVSRACTPLAQKILELEQRLDGVPFDGGLYERGKAYKKGALVTHHGSVFVATRDSADEIGTTPPSSAWRMFCQRGRDR